MGSLRFAQLCVDQLHLCGRERATREVKKMAQLGKSSRKTKKIALNIATICNNLQELAKPIINYVPLQCQKESKAVRRLERNRDKVTKLFNH